MSDDELTNFFPRYGDRVAVFAYAKQQQVLLKDRKQSLKDKLLQKLQRKTCNEEHQKRSKSQTGNLNAKKMSRKVEIGWLHKNGAHCILKQVRSPNGGGTRKLDIPMNCILKDIMMTAQELFFPGGVSKKGLLEDFEIYIADQTHTKLEETMCFQDLCENTKLKCLRLYIVTCPHDTAIDGQTEAVVNTEIVHVQQNLADTQSAKVHDPGPSMETEGCNYSSNESLPSLNMSEPGEYMIQIEGSGPSGPHFLDYGSPVHVTSMERITDVVEENNHVADFINLQPDMDENKPGIIRIHRTMVLNELIQFYKDPEIIAKSLQFIFIDEQGQDAQGVSRDVYALFWEQFLLKHTDGEDFRIPILSNELGDCEWEAIGRILVKGYRDVKYFPVSIAPAFFVAIVLGESAVTPEILKSSFMSFISKTERDVLEQALADAEHDPDDLIELLDRFECRSLPKLDTLPSMILQIAHRIIIQEPKYAIDAVQRVGQHFLVSFFPNTEQILSVFSSCEPTIPKVLGLLRANPVSKEENESLLYLKKFIRGRQKGELKKFLHFLTGSDMLCVEKIEVTFVVRHGAGRAPTAHTCGPVLELPSTYVNYPDFRNEWESILQAKENMTMMIV